MEKNEEDEDDLNDNDSSKNTVDIDALNEEGLH